MPHENKTKQKLYKIGHYTVEGLQLGKGNFAKVELATHETVGYSVALKIIDTATVQEDYVVRNLEREAKILTNLEHPNIVRLYEAVRSSTLYCLALEYVEGCDLGEYISSQKHRKVSESAARELFYQLVSAVKHMHTRKILHRDLKLENILIRHDGKVKLVGKSESACAERRERVQCPQWSFFDNDADNVQGNFGLSNFFDTHNPLKTRCGSPEYAAPELFSNVVVYGPAVDMWSLGVVLYAMLMGVLPFRYPKDEASTLSGRRQLLLEKISKGLGETHRLQMKHLTSDCQLLLQKLLEPNQSVRISLRDVVNHPWITANANLLTSVSKPPPHIVNNAVSQALSCLSVLLAKPVEDVKRKIREKPHGNIYAMFHILIFNLEMEAMKREENLRGSESFNDVSSLSEPIRFQSNRSSKEVETSSVESSFNGSNHINTKGLSRMDMRLSKILHLDKSNASVPTMPTRKVPLHIMSKKETEVQLEETPRPAVRQEALKLSNESVEKEVGGSRRKEQHGDRETQKFSVNGIWPDSNSVRGLRSERSRTKLKEELYLEDIRSLERIGRITADMRKMEDIKKFHTHPEGKNLKIKKIPKEIESDLTGLNEAELPSSRYSQKKPTRKVTSRNNFQPPAPKSPIASRDNFSCDSFENSFALRRTSSTENSQIRNRPTTKQSSSSKEGSQRIFQDTISSMQKKSFRTGALAAITVGQGSETAADFLSHETRAPPTNISSAKPTPNSSKPTRKSVLSNIIIPSLTTSNRASRSNSTVSQQKTNKGSTTTKEGKAYNRHSTSIISSLDRSRSNASQQIGVTRSGERTYSLYSSLDAANRRRSEVTSVKVPISHGTSRARATQSGQDASSDSSRLKTRIPFPSSSKKTFGEGSRGLYSDISINDIPRGFSDGNGKGAVMLGLPFPKKPTIHKRQSPHLFAQRKHKDS